MNNNAFSKYASQLNDSDINALSQYAVDTNSNIQTLPPQNPLPQYQCGNVVINYSPMFLNNEIMRNKFTCIGNLLYIYFQQYNVQSQCILTLTGFTDINNFRLECNPILINGAIRNIIVAENNGMINIVTN